MSLSMSLESELPSRLRDQSVAVPVALAALTATVLQTRNSAA